MGVGSAPRNASKETPYPGERVFKRRHGPRSLFLPVRWSHQRDMLLLQVGPAGTFRCMGGISPQDAETTDWPVPQMLMTEGAVLNTAMYYDISSTPRPHQKRSIVCTSQVRKQAQRGN